MWTEATPQPILPAGCLAMNDQETPAVPTQAKPLVADPPSTLTRRCSPGPDWAAEARREVFLPLWAL
jgi:hypothetical protein